MRLHTELGYGDGYGSTDGLPFYENYYAGGFNSVRGFKDSTLGPRSTPSRGSTNPEHHRPTRIRIHCRSVVTS